MNYYEVASNKKITPEMAARVLRAGGTVTDKAAEEREVHHYSCWDLVGEEKRCERTDFAPLSPFDPQWKVIFQGDDPWFAKNIGVITKGVAAQLS